jgi:hypothetical protein
VTSIFYVLIIVAWLGCWTFVIWYSIAYPWWRNEVGRFAIAFPLCLGLFMTYYAIRIFWPDLPGRIPAVMCLFVLLDVIVVWQLILFIRIWIEQRRRQRQRELLDDRKE